MAIAVCGWAGLHCSDDPVQRTSDTTTTEVDSDTQADADLADGDPGPIAEGCNPVAAAIDCLLPFPSDVFLVADASMPSGFRVDVGNAALKWNNASTDFNATMPADGFSLWPGILALFPEGVDAAGLIHHSDPQASLDLTGTTVLIRASDGAPVMHFAEVDAAASSPSSAAFMIRPMLRLEPETTYVVGIRSLVTPSGAPVSAPEGFRQLRDQESLDDPALIAVAERYEQDVFGPLAGAGVDRGSLQLAWSFTTRSETQAQGDLLAIRQQVMARLAAEPPQVTVKSVSEDGPDPMGRRVELEVTVPWFLDEAGTVTTLHRDAAGQPLSERDGTFELLVIIPDSLLAAGPALPAPIVQYGHGYFGLRTEIETEWLVQFADTHGLVLVAADWLGMSDPDETTVVMNMVEQPGIMFASVTNRLHQAMANQLAIAYALDGAARTLPELQVGGTLVYDPDRLTYSGISLGGILGGTFFALSPRIHDASLNVGGAAFAIMFQRSASFAALNALLSMQLGQDRIKLQKVYTLAQLNLDRVDPVTYAPLMLTAPLEPTADRHVLMQLGLGDASVPVLSGHILARSAGIPLLEPAVRPLPGFQQVSTPAGTGLVEFDFGLSQPLPGDEAVMPTPTTVHDDVRKVPAGQAQVARFLTDGIIEQFCDGPCDPE